MKTDAEWDIEKRTVEIRHLEAQLALREKHRLELLELAIHQAGEMRELFKRKA